MDLSRCLLPQTPGIFGSWIGAILGRVDLFLLLNLKNSFQYMQSDEEVIYLHSTMISLLKATLA